MAAPLGSSPKYSHVPLPTAVSAADSQWVSPSARPAVSGCCPDRDGRSDWRQSHADPIPLPPSEEARLCASSAARWKRELAARP